MKSSSMPERARYLVDAYCTDCISPEELRELESVLMNDERARRFFTAYCRMHAGLLFAVRADQAVRLARELAPSRPAAPAVFAPLGEAWQGTVAYFSQIEPLSYLLAVAITGVMLIIGAIWPVSHREQIAAAPHKPSVNRPEYIVVGQITGMAGVKWSDDPNYIPPMGVGVRLGRQYKLKSGLMEITYDSGAKVILEGPCSYEVDSTAGGYLALGRLVARVEQKVASGQWPVARNEGRGTRDEGHESANPQSPIPNPQSLATSHSPLATNPSPLYPLPSPLFAVRTPTALVTDLGTEFGVEVDVNGDTTSHVFQGTVVVQAGIRGFGNSGIGDLSIRDSGIRDSDN